MNVKKLAWLVSSVLSVGIMAQAETLERREGFKIGERMMLRPSVALSATYDTNVGAAEGHSDHAQREDFFWSISPSLWLHYNADTWSIILSGFYNYHQYVSNDNRGYDSHDYGEDFRWNWANSTGSEKGWSMVLGQSFHQRSQASSDISTDYGAYSSDARQFQLAASLQRRINQYLHGDVNASYYWLDYDSGSSRESSRSSQPFYGWDRWLVGAEAGYAASPWTDFIVSGSYHGYSQENTKDSSLSGNSSGYSIQGGIGSYMTDRISYRLMGGWSRFEYGDSGNASDGFVYTVSGNWKIGETWNTMLLATSYYQPSERQYASSARTDALSWGLAKTMVRGKLRATLDVRYRRETQNYELASGDDNDYVLDIITGRIGVSYSLVRYLAVHANCEYQQSMNDHAESRQGAYDYDRLRLTVGLVLSY